MLLSPLVVMSNPAPLCSFVSFVVNGSVTISPSRSPRSSCVLCRWAPWRPQSSRDAVRQIGNHQDGEVGLQVAAEGFMKLENKITAQFASAALVGLARIGEAVAQHPLSAGYGRQYLFVNVLGAVGE